MERKNRIEEGSIDSFTEDSMFIPIKIGYKGRYFTYRSS